MRRSLPAVLALAAFARAVLARAVLAAVARAARPAVRSLRGIAAIALVAFAAASPAQEKPVARMTQQALHEIIAATGQDVRAEGNLVAFKLRDVPILCVSDPNADRMRFVAPVKRIQDAAPEEVVAALQANFHSALDVRYALSNDMIVVAFLHPLSPLTREQVVSAIAQVASARETFGSTYSSGALTFRGF